MADRNAPNELPKAYEAADVEGRLYEWWESSGFFKAKPNPNKTPFTIIMPPPNVTGVLHLGHAVTASIQDPLIRYHRGEVHELTVPWYHRVAVELSVTVKITGKQRLLP